MSSAGHPEKSTSFYAQGAHSVVEEIENCRATKKVLVPRYVQVVGTEGEAGDQARVGVQQGCSQGN